MAAGQNTPLPGYPQQWGTKQIVIFDHYGPTSYSQSNGDAISASSLGVGGIDFIIGCDDQTKTYFAEPVLSNTGGAMSSVVLHWYTLNGTEVTGSTNLSTKIIRFVAVCV